jgi:hypothetical protein
VQAIAGLVIAAFAVREGIVSATFEFGADVTVENEATGSSS